MNKVINFLKQYLVFLSFVSILIFFYPEDFRTFWEYSWYLLTFVLIISPLSKLFPKILLFKKILLIRRSIWIIIWSLLIAHLVWFILVNNITISTFDYSKILDYNSFLFWWIWWFIFMLFPFLTSNTLSQKILKNKWKILQRFSYLFFIFWSIHIFFITWDLLNIIFLIVWIILKILAYKKVIILK